MSRSYSKIITESECGCVNTYHAHAHMCVWVLKRMVSVSHLQYCIECICSCFKTKTSVAKLLTVKTDMSATTALHEEAQNDKMKIVQNQLLYSIYYDS